MCIHPHTHTNYTFILSAFCPAADGAVFLAQESHQRTHTRTHAHTRTHTHKQTNTVITCAIPSLGMQLDGGSFVPGPYVPRQARHGSGQEGGYGPDNMEEPMDVPGDNNDWERQVRALACVCLFV